MQSYSTMVAEGAKELRRQLRFKLPNPCRDRRKFVYEVWSVGQIENNLRARLIHWDNGVPVAANPASIAKRLCKSVSEADPDIFHRMMSINLEIANGFYLQIEKAMHGKKSQHMIEKRYARSKLRRSLSIKAEIQADPGFFRIALNKALP